MNLSKNRNRLRDVKNRLWLPRGMGAGREWELEI